MRRKPSAPLRASGLVDTRDASLWLSLSLINTAIVVNALNRMLVLGLAPLAVFRNLLGPDQHSCHRCKVAGTRSEFAWTPIEASNVNAN